MLQENAEAPGAGGLGVPAEARVTLSAVMAARRREQGERDRAADALLPSIIALTSRARMPLDVVELTSRISGVDEPTIQGRLFAMMSAGWIETVPADEDKGGRLRVTDDDGARAAANAPTIFCGDHAIAREELMVVVDAASAAEEAIANFAAAYPPRQPRPAETPAAA